MISLQTRLLVAAALVLVIFLAITGFILNDVFSQQVEFAARERLAGYSNNIYLASIESDIESFEAEKPPLAHNPSDTAKTAAVLARKKNLTNEVDANNITVNNQSNNAPVANDGDVNYEVIGTPQRALSNQAFYDKHSGLYARVIDYNNKVTWRSVSIDEDTIPFNSDSISGGYTFKILKDPAGEKYFALSYSVILEKQINNKKVEHRYMFQVSESLDRLFNIQVGEFQEELVKWMGALTIVLLVSLVLVLKWWGLGPMRTVSRELEDIKAGRSHNLAGLYPKELVDLTDSIKTLIVSERAQQERYRNSLGDLAHSLKTPLAVLSGVCGQSSQNVKEVESTIREQVERMRQIVDYQLQRAAASGRTTLMTPVPVAHAVRRIINTLEKAYASKQINFIINISEQAMFIGDEGDLLELLGNITDNACKMCKQQVIVTARTDVEINRNYLSLEIEDDGPGIPEDRIKGVLKRGFRADESTSGQGIGLAVVKEIVHAYKGKMAISRSASGGAKFSFTFNNE